MRSLLATLGVLITLIAALGAQPAAAERGHNNPKPTIVLVHGAWADASSWNKVTERLQDRGYDVLAPANPLRGLAADSAYLRSILATIPGPIVLVGHSYGGMVLTNAALDDPDVVALVYITAFAPAEGESISGLNMAVPGGQVSPAILDFRPYVTSGGGGTDTYIQLDDFRRVFAADLSRRTAATLAVTQRPLELAALDEHSGPPAWATIPSWYLVATNDQVIPVDGQRLMAHRAHATTVETVASHLVLLSDPGAVTSIILDAARGR